jgi:LmbE family N-acetylglucosaminyl deacetylase|tara:strand:- start:217 stop:798 length:582 start_codon:yes stop_codon:yes gene_type:complete
MKVLVISVHPDDETLGCGGTVLKHRNQNDDIYWLILTEANESLGYSKEFIVQRTNQIKDISQEYQFSKTYSLGFPTTKLHTIDFSVIIDKIFSVIQEIKPEVIYTVNRSDIHTDHQVAAKAIMSCTKSFRNPFIKRILMYECISETEIAFPLPENMFVAHVYSDISSFLERKIEIMKKYGSELQAPPLTKKLR